MLAATSAARAARRAHARAGRTSTSEAPAPTRAAPAAATAHHRGAPRGSGTGGASGVSTARLAPLAAAPTPAKDGHRLRNSSSLRPSNSRAAALTGGRRAPCPEAAAAVATTGAAHGHPQALGRAARIGVGKDTNTRRATTATTAGCTHQEVSSRGLGRRSVEGAAATGPVAPDDGPVYQGSSRRWGPSTVATASLGGHGGGAGHPISAWGRTTAHGRGSATTVAGDSAVVASADRRPAREEDCGGAAAVPRRDTRRGLRSEQTEIAGVNSEKEVSFQRQNQRRLVSQRHIYTPRIK